MQRTLTTGRRITCLALLILSSVGAINTGLFPASAGTAVLHWALDFLLGLLPLVVVYITAGWQWRHLRDWLARVRGQSGPFTGGETREAGRSP